MDSRAAHHESPAQSGAFALPRPFGRYLLFDHIGRGGMADIFLSKLRDDLLERRVVLKLVLPELSSDETFSRMLVEEAKLAAHLQHANVVQVWDLGREEGLLYIVMEYVEGLDLGKLLARLSKARIALPAEYALFVVRETLRGLDYAHRARDAEGRRLGIVHRDVSPSNVLVSFEGEVKLCDFGIARALGDAHAGADAELFPRLVLGKAAYMSPEQAHGAPLDARADVFAAGIHLWELCAGRRLYKGTEHEMLAMARAAAVPPLPDRGLPLHDELAGVVGRALAPLPGDRFATAADFLASLETYAERAGLLASQLRFGAFLTEHFEHALLPERRARERRASEPPPPAPPQPAHEPAEADEEVHAPRLPARAATPPAEREGAARRGDEAVAAASVERDDPTLEETLSPPQTASSPPQTASSPPQTASSPPQTASSPPQTASELSVVDTKRLRASAARAPAGSAAWVVAVAAIVLAGACAAAVWLFL